MVSQTSEQGGFLDSTPRQRGDVEKLLEVPLPLGWRTVGLAQSHQLGDLLYSAITNIVRIERAGLYLPDFFNFADSVTRYKQVRSYFVTTPRYIAVLVASRETKKLANQFLEENRELNNYPADYKYYLDHPKEILGLLNAIGKTREKNASRHTSVILDDQFRKNLTDLKIVYYQWTKTRTGKEQPVLSRLN